MSSWYIGKAPQDDIVVSTRIRLARNVAGIPFPSRMSDEQRCKLYERVKNVISESNTPFAKTLKFIDMKNVPDIEKYAMVERHIVSPEFIKDDSARSVILSEDESISIMIGEEDHIRIQVIYGGLQLEKAYDTAVQLDTLLCDGLNFAFDEQLGFLTECPTNLGTGLRASVMLHLPMTEECGSMQTIAESINKIGFTVRGMYGEGSRSKASLYQISNQITLGISEKNALDNLKVIAMQLIEKERSRRSNIQKIKIEDICMRAFGILSNARMISCDEMMKLLSEIKLGMGMGIIKEEIEPIRLIIEGQLYMLMRRFGLSEAAESEIYRATMLRDALK